MAESHLGATRWPYHYSAKQVFAKNMDQLKFTVDDIEIPARQVEAAYPQANLLIQYKVDDNGKILLKDGKPVTIDRVGRVNVIGIPVRMCCGDYPQMWMIPRWWETALEV